MTALGILRHLSYSCGKVVRSFSLQGGCRNGGGVTPLSAEIPERNRSDWLCDLVALPLVNQGPANCKNDRDLVAFCKLLGQLARANAFPASLDGLRHFAPISHWELRSAASPVGIN